MTTGKGYGFIHTSLTLGLSSYVKKTNMVGNRVTEMEQNDRNVYNWNAKVSTAVLNMRCSNSKVNDLSPWVLLISQ